MEKETYETTDLSFAAYLISSGIELRRIERTNPRRVVFIFYSPPDELLTTWRTGTATVNALACRNAYEDLKRRIFEAVPA